MKLNIKIKYLIFINCILIFSNPIYAVTTKMFRVLDTCARYRIKEIDEYQAIEKLKLEFTKDSQATAKSLVKKYCSVFTPNEKIEF